MSNLTESNACARFASIQHDSIFEISERELNELNADGFENDDIGDIIEGDSDSDESEIDEDVEIKVENGDMVDSDVVRITRDTLMCL